MLYDLLVKRNGNKKETLYLTDNLAKVKARIKVLKNSWKDRSVFTIRESESEGKYRRKSTSGIYQNYQSGLPSIVRK